MWGEYGQIRAINGKSYQIRMVMCGECGECRQKVDVVNVGKKLNRGNIDK